jgi:hypothetical protein
MIGSMSGKDRCREVDVSVKFAKNDRVLHEGSDGFASSLERRRNPLAARGFWEQSPPMGLPENPIHATEEAKEARTERGLRGLRARAGLLKGCEACFVSRHARQQYSTEARREAPRQRWSGRPGRSGGPRPRANRREGGKAGNWKRVQSRKMAEKEALKAG